MSIVNSKLPSVNWINYYKSNSIKLLMLRPDHIMTCRRMNLWTMLPIYIYLYNAYILLV